VERCQGGTTVLPPDVLTSVCSLLTTEPDPDWLQLNLLCILPEIGFNSFVHFRHLMFHPNNMILNRELFVLFRLHTMVE
jgi:hypothetical protein